MITILLRIMEEDIIFEKKKHEILLLGISLHLSIEKGSLNQKRVKEVLKEKKNNYYLIQSCTYFLNNF